MRFNSTRSDRGRASSRRCQPVTCSLGGSSVTGADGSCGLWLPIQLHVLDARGRGDANSSTVCSRIKSMSGDMEECIYMHSDLGSSLGLDRGRVCRT